MKLIALRQWVCDECGELIRKPEEGYVEWLVDDKHIRYGFRIVHHALASPRQLDGNCYRYTDERGRRDMDLEQFLGAGGIVKMLSFINMGSLHDDFDAKPRIKSSGEWVKLFKRLQVPYYEEARLYWDKAEEDGFFDGANEIASYLPETLKELIERYGEK